MAGSNRNTNALYHVYYSDNNGLTPAILLQTISIDQTDDVIGSTWHSLGTFRMDPEINTRLEISTSGATGSMFTVVDGVSFTLTGQVAAIDMATYTPRISSCTGIYTTRARRLGTS